MGKRFGRGVSLRHLAGENTGVKPVPHRYNGLLSYVLGHSVPSRSQFACLILVRSHNDNGKQAESDPEGRGPSVPNKVGVLSVVTLFDSIC